MARSPTTLDPFSAIAEPRRREVLSVLARGGGELAVTAIVERLDWPQPQVSKHLAVLRQVGLVAVRRHGRKRMYSVNGAQMRTIHDWSKLFERFWEQHLDRIKRRAESRAGDRRPPTSDSKEH
jgi:DNA-binding transcriptional ArsR family regulator